MPRLRTTTISATYAGRKILDPEAQNNTLADTAFEFSRRYTTSEEQILDADSPLIRTHGNAAGNFPLSVCYDFPHESAAYEFLLGLFAFCDSHQKGELTFAAGETAATYTAGLSGVVANISRMPACWRVTANYSFVVT